jgi:hypothetical protein
LAPSLKENKMIIGALAPSLKFYKENKMIKDEETYRRILNKYFPDFTLEEVEELVQGYRIEKEKYEAKRLKEAYERWKEEDQQWYWDDCC